MNFTLHPYQKRIVSFMIGNPRAILSVDMGLGKTAATLTWLEIVQPETALIVAPKRVAETTWKQEADKWGMSIYDKMIIVAGTPEKRKKALEDPTKPYKVISRDNLKDVTGRKFEALIMDELTSFKSPDAGRSKYVQSIRAKYRYGLTGTFLANGPIDIYGQATACGLGLGYDNFYSWRANNFRDKMKGTGQRFESWIPTKPLEDLLAPIQDKIFTLTADEYLEIPDKSEVIVPVDVGPEIRKAILDLDAFLSMQLDGETVVFNEDQKFFKLQTLCNGFVYDTDSKPIRGAASTKLEAVVDKVEECKANGEPVLLFYGYQEEERWLNEMFDKRKIVRGSVRDKGFMDKWNNHEYDVLLAHPGSAGHGLNLQHGGRIVIWSTLTYNYEYYAQANARLARQGQKKNVVIYYFVADGTVEQKIVKALQRKQSDQNEFLTLTK